MHSKVLAFIYRGDEWLLLKNSPTFVAGGNQWSTVTGSIEEGEPNEKAVIREIAEETGLAAEQIIDLNWSSTYFNGELEYKENFFLVRVGEGKVYLSSEHTDSKWVNFADFLREIWWEDDKHKLARVLREALR